MEKFTRKQILEIIKDIEKDVIKNDKGFTWSMDEINTRVKEAFAPIKEKEYVNMVCINCGKEACNCEDKGTVPEEYYKSIQAGINFISDITFGGE
jgi:hypothetical protein